MNQADRQPGLFSKWMHSNGPQQDRPHCDRVRHRRGGNDAVRLPSSVKSGVFRFSFETIRQSWMSKVAQIAPGQPENAVAFVAPSALRLLHSHWTWIWSDGSVSVLASSGLAPRYLPQRVPLSPVPGPPLSWTSDPNQALSPEWSVARNRQGP